MALFSKDKPTKRVELEGAWVELQYLSKGAKDAINSQIIKACEGLDPKKLAVVEKSNGTADSLPDGLPLDMIEKINEASYLTLYKAIKAWSEEAEVSIEAVKELDTEVFEKLISEVNTMNQLGAFEVKK